MDTWTCHDCGGRALVVNGRRGREGYPGLCVTCSTKRADEADKLAIVDWLIEHLRAELAQSRRDFDDEARHAHREMLDLEQQLHDERARYE